MLRTKDEEKFLKDLGKQIVNLRKSKGISQRELSDLLGIEDSALRRVESGRTNATSITIYRIVKALETSMSELYGFDS